MIAFEGDRNVLLVRLSRRFPGRANRAVVEAISKAYLSGDDVSSCGVEIIRNLAKRTPEVQEALDVWGGVRFE